MTNFADEPQIEIILGDVREELPKLPADHFDCVVTSPPYWGQRDYGFDGQIGLEETAGEHIQVLVEVMREVRRVLKPTGVVWLNYGDNYAGAVNGRSAADTKAAGNDDRTYRDKPVTCLGDTGTTAYGVIKNKDLIGMPWMLALALRADGWWLRSCVIWNKSNPKPESVHDRPATNHEYMFMLTKSERYFYDVEAVKEPAAGNIAGAVRNRRSVWDLKVQPFPEVHFATFPESLVDICIRASCSRGGCCATCGKPAAPIIKRGEPNREHQRASGGNEAGEYHGTAVKSYAAGGAENASDLKRRILAGMVAKSVVGWKRTCDDCPPDPDVRPRVLDPFGGAGTVGLVAARNGADAILIEAKEEYAELALRRINEAPTANDNVNRAPYYDVDDQSNAAIAEPPKRAAAKRAKPKNGKRTSRPAKKKKPVKKKRA